MSHKTVIGVIVVVGLMAIASNGYAQSWNMTEDFSRTSNTADDVWQYHYGPRDSTTHIPVFDDDFYTKDWEPKGPDGDWKGGAWAQALGPPDVGAGYIAHNDKAVERVFGIAVYAPGAIGISPPGGPVDVTSVVWKSPISGTVDITFEASSGLSSPDGKAGNLKYYVDLNDSSGNLASGDIQAGVGTSGTQTLNGVSVNVGDTVHFIIDPDGSSAWDLGRYTASINIPEPSSCLLMGLSLIALLSLSMREKK